VSLVDRLAASILDRALSGRSERAIQRREFRRTLLQQLRDYSALVEQVRIRLLIVRDQLFEGEALQWPVVPETVLSALENGYDQAIVASGEGEVDLATEQQDDDELIVEGRSLLRERANAAASELSPEFPEVVESARSRVVELDEAWSALRPRLDEAVDLEAVEYLRSYRHNFRHLTVRTLNVLERLADEQTSETLQLAREYVEATLWAADHWNAQIMGTIDEVRDDRPM
jgi:hypothetical protein